MFRKTFEILLAVLVLAGVVAGCADTEEADMLRNELAETKGTLADVIDENEILRIALRDLEKELREEKGDSLIAEALSVADVLARQDMEALAGYADPVEGVRFSPYAHVELQSDVVLTARQIGGAMDDPTIYNWGSYDGSGEAIEETFAEYFGEFVYDEDFASPHIIGNNVRVGTGNSINNIAEAYPGGVFVELHFTGFNPQYEGMDWRSLRLVFKESGGLWRLVGIVHDQWTI